MPGARGASAGRSAPQHALCNRGAGRLETALRRHKHRRLEKLSEGGCRHSGPEIQIQDNLAGRDPQKAGWLYQLYKPEGDADKEADATKPAGEWNTLRVLITPAACETSMNGVKYYSFVKGSPDWDERVAKSKFSAMPAFGKATKGHLTLQDHGDLVSFRNIKIRPLDAK